MKKAIFVAALIGAMGFAHAEETMGEKAKATGRDAKHSLKKGTNRVGEKLCMDSDAECLAKKAGNRAEEAGGKVSDKAKELGNSVDKD